MRKLLCVLFQSDPGPFADWVALLTGILTLLEQLGGIVRRLLGPRDPPAAGGLSGSG